MTDYPPVTTTFSPLVSGSADAGTMRMHKCAVTAKRERQQKITLEEVMGVMLPLCVQQAARL